MSTSFARKQARKKYRNSCEIFMAIFEFGDVLTFKSDCWRKICLINVEDLEHVLNIHIAKVLGEKYWKCDRSFSSKTEQEMLKSIKFKYSHGLKKKLAKKNIPRVVFLVFIYQGLFHC